MKKEILTEQDFKTKYQYHNLTPIMQQYLDLKFKHQDCLLLFRLGDFYELFFEDAKIASSLLNLILTTRDKNTHIQIPMCGMPFHSVEPYITRLINEGYKIAVCEQTESPLEAKKRGAKALVNRQIEQILTQGTVIDATIVDSNKPNYLASVVFDFKKQQCAICFVDLGAREIAVICQPIDQFKDEITNLNPKEILISISDFENSQIMPILKDFIANITPQADSFFAIAKNIKIIKDFYNIKTCDSISAQISDMQIQAIGAAIEYILITKKQVLALPHPKIISTQDFMLIDSNSVKNLEIVSCAENNSNDTLFRVLNYTKSYAGSRMLYKYLLKPLIKKKIINERLNVTDFFYKNIGLMQDIQKQIKSAGDIERAFSKINVKKANISDFVCVKNTLDASDKIKDILLAYINMPILLEKILKIMPNNLYIKDEIAKAINPNNIIINLSEGGFINPSYHPKLQTLQNEINQLYKLQNELILKYKKITQIDALKIQSNMLHGTFIEVPIKKSQKIDANIFIHKQTTVNSARFTTKELEKSAEDIYILKKQSASLEALILEQLIEKIIQNSVQIHNIAQGLAQIDVFCAFATAAKENNYIMPILQTEKSTAIYQGRHPVVEKSLQKIAKNFVANDCIFSNQIDLMVLTGPNMGGKSTFLRQNALIILMAHIGCFVPAEKAVISITDKIFTRIGAGDNLSKGHSTFMLEMVETAAILSQATNKSFIILDEVGRGTSTYDGMSIACACAEYIANSIKSKCIFATHYHEITKLTNNLGNAQNYTAFATQKDNKVLFEYLIKPGSASKSYGINVARIAGLPEKVIQRAKQILNTLES